jgi:hypothetical protein
MLGTGPPSAHAAWPFQAAGVALVQDVPGQDLAAAALHDVAG